MDIVLGFWWLDAGRLHDAYELSRGDDADRFETLNRIARECKAYMGTKMIWDRNNGNFANEIVINDQNDEMRTGSTSEPPRFLDVWMYHFNDYGISPVLLMQKSQTGTLKEACFKVVGQHFLRIASIPEINRWLLGIPSHLINKITSFIPDRKLHDPDCVEFILQTRCTSLKLPRFPSNDFLPNFENLTHLDIAGYRIPPVLYYQLVVNLPKVITLSLESTFAFDKILRILVEHSPSLESLNLKDNPAVSDEGIEYLCSVEVSPNSRVPRDSQIHTLEINDTNVTMRGCYFALIHLPRLTDIPFHESFSIFSAYQERLRNLPSDMPFLIKSLHSTHKRDRINGSQILLANRLCPNVMHLEVYLVIIKPEFLPDLANFKNLTHLKLRYWDRVKFDTDSTILKFIQLFPSFLQIRGSALTILELSYVPANLNLIGMYCPNLVELRLKYVCYKDDPPIVNEGKIFQNVIDLEVLVKIYSECQPTKEDLTLLLGNCTQLEHLIVERVDAVNPDLLSEILSLNPMCCLESVFFNLCENMKGECLSMLVESVPSLIKVKVSN